jgi:hypothetical protein
MDSYSYSHWIGLHERPGVGRFASAFPAQTPSCGPRQGPSVRDGLLIASGVVLCLYILSEVFAPEEEYVRRCGVCGKPDHDRRTCPYAGPRVGFGNSIPKSAYCECCGKKSKTIQRHHTKGRASLQAFRDLCLSCHLNCGHEGNYQNLPIDPGVCRMTGDTAAWRAV